MNLPESWSRIKLGDIFATSSGGTPNRKNKNYFSGEIPWLKSGELKDDYISESEEKITREALHSSSAKIFPNGSLLIALYGATVGRLGILKINATTNQAICAIFLPTIFPSKYYFYLLFSKRRDLLNSRIGGAQPNISQSILRNLILPLPPLNEQYRIVEKIEELFTKLDSAEKELQNVKKQLKRYRQSVLKSAFEGKLTEEWRKERIPEYNIDEIQKLVKDEVQAKYNKDLDNAKEKNISRPKHPWNSKKSDFEYTNLPFIPEEWKLVRLEELCYKVSDGTHHTPKYLEKGVKFLSVKNVRPYKILDKDIKYISDEEHFKINNRCNSEMGDILYTKVGATFGYASIANVDYPFSIFVSLALIKPVHKYIFNKYLEFLMNSEIVFAQARERVSGSGRPDLHLVEIRDFRIPLTILEEQYAIVSEIETRFSVADKMEEEIDKNLKLTQRLRQSIRR